MATYTVVKGDCLWTISKSKLGAGNRWREIANLNTSKYPSLKNSTIIQPGWVLEIPSGGSSTTKKAMTRAIVEFLGPLAGEERTLFCVWSWDRTSDLEKYLVEWIYTVGGGRIIYDTQDISVSEGHTAAVFKQTTWQVPDDAVKVKIRVKPVAKTKRVNNTDVIPWTASWSTIGNDSTFYASNFPPETPPMPSLSMGDDGVTLTIRVDNIDDDYSDRKSIYVQLIKNDDETKPYKTYHITPNDTSAIHVSKVGVGARYKARCRMIHYDPKTYSEWTLYTQNVYSRPKTPTKVKAKAVSENDVRLEWVKVENVTGYEYQYTMKVEYFDTAPAQVTTGSVDNTVNIANIVDLETGNFTYFFRIRSKGEGGDSAWSDVISLTLGKEPAAPTTWSSATTVIVGEPVNLYWVHNSEDGSSQTYAELEFTVNESYVEKHTIKNSYTDEDDRDNTSVYALHITEDLWTNIMKELPNPNGYVKVLWRVRTAGVLTNKYGDWSVQREIQIHVRPTIDLQVTSNLEGDALFELTSFPFYVSASAGPEHQVPVGYHLKIVANESYETVDRIGNKKIVSVGETVYSKYFDCDSDTSLYVMMTPSNIDLENNISYTVTCTVSMNSGLTAEDSTLFVVAWEEDEYIPNAVLGYLPSLYTMMIRPYCSDSDGVIDGVDDVTLSVFRREYDGSFTEIMSGLENNGYTFVTDPHPALDTARYRIVATDKKTGAISYVDIPGYVIGESSAIIQWDEAWSDFDAVEEEPLFNITWAGSLIRLPYNIDISASNTKDVSLVEYVGREHPVAYYGTQLGESITLKTDIPVTDVDTLYALRRLMVWKGDVYVRLPNGIGHWASVSVQYNESHNNLKIPVTIDITRVEGGV